MATWGAGYEAKPTDSDSPTLGDNEIRATRSDTRARMENEHLTYNDATAGAESEDFRHREGSARVFYGGSEPSNAPSGGSLEDGHIWINSTGNTLLVHDGTVYQKLQVTDDSGAVVKTGAQTIEGVKTFDDGITIGDAGTALKTKVISITFIGGYSASGAHGLTYSKIRGVLAVPPTDEFINYIGTDGTYITLTTVTPSTGQAYATVFYVP